LLGLLLIGVQLAAPPPFVVEGGLEPRAALAQAATRAWLDLERFWREANDSAAPKASRAIRVAPATNARPAESGTSRLGRIDLRAALVLDDRQLLTLRHEVAHQFLFSTCPAASDDRLFHEAFAVATSGELDSWTRGEYLSTPRALRMLKRARSLDTPSARRALARLLAEGGSTGLPVALARRLRLCAAGSRWSEPVTLEELSAPGAGASGSALVVLSRHSGEVLLSEGAANVAMPYGSTLKPFLIAGARGRAPKLRSHARRPEWMCGADVPAWMDGDTALLLSCNGYFLDWGARDANAAGFGRFGPLLVRLGLGRLPQDTSEAIGARPTLALSPWALAQAYRALALASPRTIEVMTRNADHGTLSGLPASRALAGIATKTGTVRDPESRPTLGWVVAVTDDLVVVTAVENRAPRTFVGLVAKNIERARALPGQSAAQVQTFGLLPPAHVQARCSGIGVVLNENLSLVDTSFLPLIGHLEHGPAMCLGAPWQVRFPESDSDGRPYAGVFTLSPLPPPTRTHKDATRKQQRARRGSDMLFSTSVGRYVTGVLTSEDAAIRGEARVALGRVIAHNLAQPRHGERPLCDTTHCQVFQGTGVPALGDQAIFAGLPLPFPGWLHFSRGGEEPWTRSIAANEVDAILGNAPTGIVFASGRIRYRRTVARGSQVYDEPAELPCDALRSRLRLPACPERVETREGNYLFTGRGQGHGVGLDVEWAKKSKLPADQILRHAY